MKFIVQFSDQQSANQFVKFVDDIGAKLIIQQHNYHYQIYLPVEQIAKLDSVEKKLQQFIAEQSDTKSNKYMDGWEQLSNNGKSSHQQISNIKIPIFPIIKRTGVFTMLITVISILSYGTMLFLTSLFLLLHYPLPTIQTYQIWRYITPIFIHFSIMHIAFNLAIWWFLGDLIERKLGTLKLMEIIFVAAIISNIAQFSSSGMIFFGGLSGVVYALIGYSWLFGMLKPSVGVTFYGSMIVLCILSIILGYTNIITGLGNASHLFGLIVGFILAAKDAFIIKVK